MPQGGVEEGRRIQQVDGENSPIVEEQWDAGAD